MWPKLTRRRVLQSLFVSGIGYTGYRYSRQKVVRTAIIGAGGRAGNFAGNSRYTCLLDVQSKIVSICDVDRSRAEAMRAKHAPSAEVTQNYRHVLERDDIDAVFVVTPDHWHVPISLEAMECGKHVYCEKPMTLTIAEGWKLREAVKRTGKVFLVGTQQRSDRNFQLACELVRNGRLGQLHTVKIAIPERASGGPFQPQPIPANLDWDRWLGPAPLADYCPERFYGFRNFYEYSGGVMTDWGAHHLDITQLAMGLDHLGPNEISSNAELPQVVNGFNTPGKFTVNLKYKNGVTVHVATSEKENAILFEGDTGRIRVTRGSLTGKPFEELSSKPLPPDAVRIGHQGMYVGNAPFIHLWHFLRCIAHGESPISDVNSQHRSVSACHLANISLRLQRKIYWDPENERFANDPDACELLSRTSRELGPLFAEKEPVTRG